MFLKVFFFYVSFIVRRPVFEKVLLPVNEGPCRDHKVKTFKELPRQAAAAFGCCCHKAASVAQLKTQTAMHKVA